GVDIGVMILGGLVVGMVTITFGYLYAAWANRKWTIPPRDSGNITRAELQSLMEKDSASLPPLWLALLPIVLPILLISGNTITSVWVENTDTVWMAGLSSIGDSNMALTISAFISLGILAWSVRDREKIKTYMADAMQSAGLIILITSMGGAFGSVLQQTGIGARIQDLATDYQLAILPLAFFVTVLMRTAQGSSTVAMITSVGIIGGIANMGDLPFHPVYLALAIGCGSKPFPWMNDSGFWIACKMAGMTEGETLKTFTAVLGIMGFSGLFVIIVLAKLFPFI
ncbi:MAG: GntP family permease, partial [Cyclobacteriaceae bacterium]|nr:GntP family permease [Cyclobacteriaceae bacterium]